MAGGPLAAVKDAVKQLLDDNPDLMEEIEARVKEAISAKSLVTA